VRLIHYQTLEPLREEELQALRRIKEQYNENRGFWERIKLWRKGDILSGLEPQDSRWGYTRVRNEEDRQRLLLTLKRMSEATPNTTWIVYDDGDGGSELLLRGGKVIGGTA
jgi:hypothetical protein